LGLIYLDSCLLIYLVERHPLWGDRLAEAFGYPAGRLFGISPLVKCECLVGPIKRGDAVLRQLYAIEFERFVPLAMPEPIYLLAAELRAQFGIATPDALHLACAQHHRCDELWTNDDRLARISPGYVRNILADA